MSEMLDQSAMLCTLVEIDGSFEPGEIGGALFVTYNVSLPSVLPSVY